MYFQCRTSVLIVVARSCALHTPRRKKMLSIIIAWLFCALRVPCQLYVQTNAQIGLDTKNIEVLITRNLRLSGKSSMRDVCGTNENDIIGEKMQCDQANKLDIISSLKKSEFIHHAFWSLPESSSNGKKRKFPNVRETLDISQWESVIVPKMN